jgi:Indole-3-glycerol phosphate synthase
VTGLRRLSHAISEGEGISVLVVVADREAARAAESQGAKGVAITEERIGVRDATPLPLLWSGAGGFREASGAGADAVVLAAAGAGDELEELFDEAQELGLECVLRVRDEDELEDVLERVDPEILLLAAARADDGEPQLEKLLDLLPDVPAGKLAIAELPRASRDDVAELERAGVDAVLVTGNADGLVDPPPQV